MERIMNISCPLRNTLKFFLRITKMNMEFLSRYFLNFYFKDLEIAKYFHEQTEKHGETHRTYFLSLKKAFEIQEHKTVEVKEQKTVEIKEHKTVVMEQKKTEVVETVVTNVQVDVVAEETVKTE